MLDITYDPEADAAYIQLDPGEIVESEEVTAGIIFDYDREGRVLGIEVLHASKLLPVSALADAPLPRIESIGDGLLAQNIGSQKRAQMIDEARRASRRLRDDPADRDLLADVIDMQAENADAFRP
jgi:uncharacterized protein YuzE